MSHLEIKTKGLKAEAHTMRMFPQVIQDRMPTILNRAIDVAWRKAETAVPVRTGTLKASIYAGRSGQMGIRIGATAPHAVFVEKGTRPHIITPKRPGGVLRFLAGGGAAPWTNLLFGNVVFTKRVRHPGTKAQPFLRPAAEEAQRMIPQFTWDEVQSWLRSRGWK